MSHCYPHVYHKLLKIILLILQEFVLSIKMPRNPPRKTNIGTFSEQQMISAVERVLNGSTVRSVAKENG